MMKYYFEPCFVNITNENEYINSILDTINTGSKKTFFYLNSHSYYLANKNFKFNEAFNKGDYIIADGYSIVWAIKKIHRKKIDKVVFTYSFFTKLKTVFEEQNARIFILGGSEELMQKSKIEFEISYPKINVVGFHHGYFNKISESEKIIEMINSSNPNVLIVGMGLPISEIWIQDNINKINTNCIFSVGGFFDVLSGSKSTAPKWLYNSGFEWVYRLIKEPGRLFGRYFKANLYFIKSFFRAKLRLSDD